MDKPVTKQSKLKKYRGWLLSFFIPFFIVGTYFGISYYHHLEKDIGRVYSAFGKNADYISMLESAGVAFVLTGIVSGLIGLLIFAGAKGILFFLKKPQ